MNLPEQTKSIPNRPLSDLASSHRTIDRAPAPLLPAIVGLIRATAAIVTTVVVMELRGDRRDPIDLAPRVLCS